MKKISLIVLLILYVSVCFGNQKTKQPEKFKLYFGIALTITGILIAADGAQNVPRRSGINVDPGVPGWSTDVVWERKSDSQIVIGCLTAIYGGYLIITYYENKAKLTIAIKF